MRDADDDAASQSPLPAKSGERGLTHPKRLALRPKRGLGHPKRLALRRKWGVSHRPRHQNLHHGFAFANIDGGTPGRASAAGAS